MPVRAECSCRAFVRSVVPSVVRSFVVCRASCALVERPALCGGSVVRVRSVVRSVVAERRAERRAAWSNVAERCAEHLVERCVVCT